MHRGGLWSEKMPKSKDQSIMARSRRATSIYIGLNLQVDGRRDDSKRRGLFIRDGLSGNKWMRCLSARVARKLVEKDKRKGIVNGLPLRRPR
jgi:hypothetical protein